MDTSTAHFCLGISDACVQQHQCQTMMVYCTSVSTRDILALILDLLRYWACMHAMFEGVSYIHTMWVFMDVTHLQLMEWCFCASQVRPCIMCV